MEFETVLVGCREVVFWKTRCGSLSCAGGDDVRGGQRCLYRIEMCAYDDWSVGGIDMSGMNKRAKICLFQFA